MNSFIITGDGKQYPITLNQSDKSFKITANVADFADYDGDFVNKRSNRGLDFPLNFLFTGENYYENTQSFLESVKDTRPCTFYFPEAENGIKAQIISISWKENFVKNIECTEFSLTLHETLSESDFENWYDEYIFDNDLQFADYVVNPEIQKCTTKIKKGTFKVNFAKITGFLDNTVSKFTGFFTRNLSYPQNFMSETQKVILSVNNAKKTLRASFSNALLMHNALLNSVKQIAALNPFALHSFVNFISDVFSQNVPETDENANFDNDYFNAVTLPAAKAVYDCVNLIDYKTNFSREQLVKIQKTVFKIYDDYKIISLNPTETPVLEMLAKAILHVDEIFKEGKIERRETLSCDTDLYAFVGKIYPSVTPDEYEANLERFIFENNLHADDLFVLKRGKKVVYYV